MKTTLNIEAKMIIYEEKLFWFEENPLRNGCNMKQTRLNYRPRILGREFRFKNNRYLQAMR